MVLIYPPKKILLFLVLIAIISGLYLKTNFKIPATQSNNLSPPKILSQEEFINLNPQVQYKYIEDLAGQIGVEKTWQFINQSYQNNQLGQSRAHDLSHLIGGIIYKKKGFAGLSVCTPNFAFGCYHGFLDEAFSQDTKNLLNAERSCEQLGEVNTGPVASCIHGIGHGLASFYQTRDIESSLKECDRLNTGQTFCYDGVFMEFVRSAAPSFYDKTDPLSPCDKLPNVYTSSCGRNQPQVLIQRFNLSFLDVVNICASSPNQNLIKSCFDALGFYTVTLSNGDVNNITKLCGDPQITNFNQKCLKAAAGELVFQNFPGWSNSSQKICLSQINQSDQEDCLQYTRQLANEYHRISP